MTEETKKLFNAPLSVGSDLTESYFEIQNMRGEPICRDVLTQEYANRIICLPELYDALNEAVKEECGNCAMMMVDSNSYDFVKCGCPFYEDHDDCMSIKWIELLRKVRDGK